MKLSKAERERVRMMFGGRCAYCGCELPENGWHADHVKPVKRDWEFVKDASGNYVSRNGVTLTRATGKLFNPENNRIDNIFPSCRACNIDKSAEDLESWRIQIKQRVRVCRDNHSAFRHAERFGLVQEIKKQVVFYFETFGENDVK